MDKLVSHLIGHRVLIRSADSGVHHGTLVAIDGTAVRLENSRRLWEWSTGGTGLSLSEVAICGIDHKGSKITMVLPDIIISGVCEIIPTHGMCDATIDGAPVHKP
tara:strand:- start:457 stop:771 length:315 start_codon:yes stop_codon:yes gene_type:complete